MHEFSNETHGARTNFTYNRNILLTNCIISACCGFTSIRFDCSLYTFHDPQYSTWEESRRLCNSSGSDLVSIEEFQEWQFLNNTLQTFRTVKYYIGLTKDKRTRQWSWLSNGKSVNATTGKFPWAKGEPHSGDGPNCATMYKDYRNNYGLFDDLHCFRPYSDAGYICEMAVACMNEVPTSFNVTPLTPTSVRASWAFTSWDSLPLGVVIRGFKLLYRLRNSSNLFGTAIVWGNSTFSKNISGLEKYAEYEFKVLAFTANGDGPSSSVLVVRTDEDVPSLAPANFIVASQTSTSILASWQPPPIHSRNGIIIGFKLFYKRKGSSNSGYTVYIHDALTYNATGLLKYTEYELQVLAFTKIGDGRNSSVLTTRTRQDVPSQAPVNLRVASKTSTSIMVSWQPPPLDSRNGIIIGFKLFYKRKKNSTDLGQTVNIRNALTHNATRLLKYTEYEFQVLAFTQIGNGPSGSVLATRTKQDVPSQAPVNFTVASQTSTSILASWQLPPTDSRNGIIIGFKLFHKRKGSTESANTELVQGGTTFRKTITGLLKYTEYEVQVLAFTAVGDGPKTLIKTVRTFSVPIIEEDLSPPFVICEMGTLCLLFCFATSEYPKKMMYSWTKNGISLADGDTFKIINNSVVVRPHRMEDYGVYACKASNGIYAATYNITLRVKVTSCAVVVRRAENGSHDIRFVITVTALSTVIMLLLIPIGLLLWQRRKMPRQNTNVSEDWHTHSQSRALMSLGSETEQAYMELQPQGGSLKHVYQTLQGKAENTDFNVQSNKDNVVQDAGDYEIAATF